MKKILSVRLIFCISICFAGCKEEEVVLPSYDITVEVLQDMSLDCEMEYSFVSNNDNQSGIYFTLYPNSFDNHDKNRNATALLLSCISPNKFDFMEALPKIIKKEINKLEMKIKNIKNIIKKVKIDN